MKPREGNVRSLETFNIFFSSLTQFSPTLGSCQTPATHNCASEVSRVYRTAVYNVALLSISGSQSGLDGCFVKIFQRSDVFFGFGPDIVLIAGSASHISR